MANPIGNPSGFNLSSRELGKNPKQLEIAYITKLFWSGQERDVGLFQRLEPAVLHDSGSLTGMMEPIGRTNCPTRLPSLRNGDDLNLLSGWNHDTTNSEYVEEDK